MARRGGQQPVKGFRPGKEPPQLKKRRAREQFGELNTAQERLVELFAERTPEESKALVRRWRTWMLAGAILLGVAAIALVFWSVVAAAVAGGLAAALAVLWWRLHSQYEALLSMADQVSGGKRTG